MQLRVFCFRDYDHSLKLQNRTGAQNDTSFEKRTNKTKQKLGGQFVKQTYQKREETKKREEKD